jgi:hypothetical protein
MDEKTSGAQRPEATDAQRSFGEVARAVIGGNISRRRALRWIGGALSGAVLARFPGLTSAAAAPRPVREAVPVEHGAQLRGLLLPAKNRSLEGRFGFMFKKLPAFEPPDELLIELATGMQEPAGTPPAVPDNPRVPIGFVFLGQFIDHDLTFDATPIPQQREDPDARTNFRTARLDLDSLYGVGPRENPELYDPDDPAKLRIAAGLGDPDVPDDLPRRDDTAIIGDPRDDENIVTSQLHLAFRKFHNALVDHVRAKGLRTPDLVFEEAQRLCRWHYQWMVIHDYLPTIVGQEVLNEILQERPGAPAKVRLSFYKPENPNKPMMPIEFAVAAYRFGHSMLPHRYVLNEQTQNAVLFVEDPDLPGSLPSLNGRRPLKPELEIDWRYFFKIPDVPGVSSDSVNYARPIDSNLSIPLFTLPKTIVPPPDTRFSLAERNLLRGKRLGLPSGQRVAREMGVEVLPNEQLDLGDAPGWDGQAPLWYYVLKEAELRHAGEKLGAVGGRIVAETILGLLERDRRSYLGQDASFSPAPPIAREHGSFEIGDLLRFAGVVV